MNNLNKKQKIILIIIGIILIAVIGIIGFIFSKGKEGSTIDLNNLLSEEDIKDLENENQDNKTNENSTNNLDNLNNTNSAQNNNIEDSNLQGNKIVVHITGEVKKTGILILDEGARIADAIKAAGGTTSEANIDDINLAYKLQDGQKIYIPNKKDKQKNEIKEYITSESGNNVIIQENNSETGGKTKKVNINTATQSELETLPGIGEAMAKRIIEYREQNGKFQKIEDLKNVKGIGEAKFNKMKELVTV